MAVATLNDGSNADFKVDQAVFILPDPENMKDPEGEYRSCLGVRNCNSACCIGIPRQDEHWIGLIKEIRANVSTYSFDSLDFSDGSNSLHSTKKTKNGVLIQTMYGSSYIGSTKWQTLKSLALQRGSLQYLLTDDASEAEISTLA